VTIGLVRKDSAYLIRTLIFSLLLARAAVDTELFLRRLAVRKGIRRKVGILCATA
jgi:hypothetical protein